MEGLTESTRKYFDIISKMESIKGYTLIGGTAISLQIKNRLSEDLDFCKWSLPEKHEVDWVNIKEELDTFCPNIKTDILDFNQVNFIANDVRLSFYVNHMYKEPQMSKISFYNNIELADLETLGALKIEVSMRRLKFRDYYDIFCLLREGISLKNMVEKAMKYSNHNYRSISVLSKLYNCNYLPDSNFSLLKPKYSVTAVDIKKEIGIAIKKEFGHDFISGNND